MISSGVASHDGRIKRGDRIISVNGKDFNGMTNKSALRVLKNAGDQVTIVLSRKGRRSRATTPMASVLHSQQGSPGETSCAESRRMSPQALYRSRGRGVGSSDEGSQEGSRGPSPQPSRRHRRRESMTAQGELLTFRDKTSTLPRKLKGAKRGVHLVELHKGPTGLGVQLQGGTEPAAPIIVKAILRGGPAFKSGKIHEGDEILEVNGQSFEDLNHQEALKVMKSLPQGKVSIILREHKATSP